MKPRCIVFGEALSLFLNVLAVSAAQDVDFAKDVRPIFAEHCAQCHGPDEGNRMADLHLDIPETFRTEADGYAIIVPGEPESSELHRRITATGEDELFRMPPAYERLVDRLLASPHYAERWARHGLDIVVVDVRRRRIAVEECIGRRTWRSRRSARQGGGEGVRVEGPLRGRRSRWVAKGRSRPCLSFRARPRSRRAHFRSCPELVRRPNVEWKPVAAGSFERLSVVDDGVDQLAVCRLVLSDEQSQQ